MNSKVKPAPAGPPLTEDELKAIERLDRVHGVGGLKSALLALLVALRLANSAAHEHHEAATFGQHVQ